MRISGQIDSVVDARAPCSHSHMIDPPEGYEFSDLPAIHAGNGRYLIWHPSGRFDETSPATLEPGWRWLRYPTKAERPVL